MAVFSALHDDRLISNLPSERTGTCADFGGIGSGIVGFENACCAASCNPCGGPSCSGSCCVGGIAQGSAGTCSETNQAPCALAEGTHVSRAQMLCRVRTCAVSRAKGTQAGRSAGTWNDRLVDNAYVADCGRCAITQVGPVELVLCIQAEQHTLGQF